MVISLVQDMITYLNMFTSKNGILINLIPVSIILGSHNPDYNKLKITFVAYTQVYICTNNSTKNRTLGEIALIPEN